MKDNLSIIATAEKVTIQQGSNRIDILPVQVKEVITNLRRLGVISLILQGKTSEI